MRTDIRLHVQKWSGCKACRIGELAAKHVFYRGAIPARFLFIGEAPGKAEDVTGEPFVGPVGKALDELIAEVGMPAGSYGITNVVACRPTDCAGGPNRIPSEKEAKNCAPRLEEMIRLSSPLAVILLGKVAENYVVDLLPVAEGRVICLPHPAYILRQGGKRSETFRTAAKNLNRFIRQVEA